MIPPPWRLPAKIVAHRLRAVGQVRLGDVADDTNDPLRRVESAPRDPSDRIFTGEVFLDERVIDDDRQRRVRVSRCK